MKNKKVSKHSSELTSGIGSLTGFPSHPNLPNLSIIISQLISIKYTCSKY